MSDSSFSAANLAAPKVRKRLDYRRTAVLYALIAVACIALASKLIASLTDSHSQGVDWLLITFFLLLGGYLLHNLWSYPVCREVAVDSAADTVALSYEYVGLKVSRTVRRRDVAHVTWNLFNEGSECELQFVSLTLYDGAQLHVVGDEALASDLAAQIGCEMLRHSATDPMVSMFGPAPNRGRAREALGQDAMRLDAPSPPGK